MQLGPLVLLAAAAGLYARAVLVLRGRGRRVPPWQQAAYGAGIVLTAAGLVGPVDTWSEDLLSAHMAQHLLIADLAAPLLLVGVRTPILQHMLPPAVLRPLARQRWLRRTLATLRRPLVAIPIFVVSLYGWHFAPAFEAAHGDPFVHALQHMSFVGGALLVWWPVLEPDKARLRGELWKAGHVLAARFLSMFVAMAFLISREPLYAIYDGARGLDAMADQRLAGALMLGLDWFVVLFALAFFFWRAAADHDREERRESERRATAAG